MWQGPPLVVMNNFSATGRGAGASQQQQHLQLATALFQSLFPAINVQTAKLSACQRVLLLDHDRQTGRISLRHFSISVAPSGVTKNLKVRGGGGVWGHRGLGYRGCNPRQPGGVLNTVDTPPRGHQTSHSQWHGQRCGPGQWRETGSSSEVWGSGPGCGGHGEKAAGQRRGNRAAACRR